LSNSMEAYKKKVIEDLTKPALDRWLKHLRESPSDSLEESRRRLMEATKLVNWIDQLTDPRGIPFHTSKQQQLFLEKHPPPKVQEEEEESNPRKAEYYGEDEPFDDVPFTSEEESKEKIQELNVDTLFKFFKYFPSLEQLVKDELESFYDSDTRYFSAVTQHLADEGKEDGEQLQIITNAYTSTLLEKVNAMSAQEIVDKCFELSIPTEDDRYIRSMSTLREHVWSRLTEKELALK